MERQISRRAVVFGATVGGAGAVLVGAPALAAPYRDPAGGFSMDIPTGWTARPSNDAAVPAQWLSKDGQALVNVSRTMLPPSTSSVGFLNRDYDQRAQADDLTLLDDGYLPTPTGQGTQPVLRFLSTDDAGRTYQADILYVANGNTGWEVTYVSYLDATADHEREFLGMARTFTVSGAAMSPAMASAAPITPAAPGATLPGAMMPSQMMPAAPAVVVQPRAGYVGGTVLDARGQVIAVKTKISVTVNGISSAGENVSYSPPVNAMGQYSQRVTDGSYSVNARLVYTDATGQLFTFSLEPQEPNVSYDSAAGIVKNFRWKISGPIPDTNAGSTSINDYYGWSLDLNLPQSMPTKDLPTLYPGGKIRATLTPSGPLWDGSPSATITREAPIQPLSDTFGVQMYDFPYGLYTLRVVVVDAGGTVHPLKVGPRYDLVTLPSMLLTLTPRGSVDGAYQEEIYIGA